MLILSNSALQINKMECMCRAKENTFYETLTQQFKKETYSH